MSKQPPSLSEQLKELAAQALGDEARNYLNHAAELLQFAEQQPNLWRQTARDLINTDQGSQASTNDDTAKHDDKALSGPPILRKSPSVRMWTK